jgi:DNA phosphorothioation-dependent restriction protein DptF
MSGCNFISKLNKLRKSSSDSIDNVDSFDGFKEYMHVVRDAEKDLKAVLRQVNVGTKKTLVLLCGSAGDGKSHLLSYLKNSDTENLLENYIIHNDATESNAPEKTAIDTLCEVLSGFKDNNLDSPGKNIILAINLGVLSNFIESQYGEDFKSLKQYVFNANILSSKVNERGYDPNSYFQHISFSDYHMFLLEKDGINPEYINALFEKIVSQNESNPFYASYKEDCSSCPLSSKCPIKKNYEFFMDEKVRRYIAMLLVNVIVREKEILTTRELLNYVFDILVAQDFDFARFQKSSVNVSKFLKEYLGCIMPTILFDCDDVTSIMNKTHKYDPLLDRDEAADDLAIEYYVADDVSNTIKKLLVDSPYVDIFHDKSIIEIINTDRALKSKLFNVLVRTKAITMGMVSGDSFQKYVRDLFSYNAGKVSKLSNLYSDVEDAVTNWCGNESEGNICIDDQHKEFALYENIKFEAFLDNMPHETSEDRLNRFLPYIIVEFQDASGQSIRLDVDYSLYELIGKLKKGYVQTAEDRNNHADFISFITKILKTGSADKYMTAISEKGQKAVLEKTKFGIYKFKVVK